MITGVRTIAIYVADTDRSRRFYQELLGLPITSEHAGRVQLDVAGLRLLLHPTHVDVTDQNLAPHGRTEVYFTTDDVDGEVRNLSKAGVELVQEPTDQPWGERDAAVLDCWRPRGVTT